MKKICDKSEVTVIRNHQDYTDRTILMDCDGCILAQFSEDVRISDAMKALDFANDAYNKGFNAGKSHSQTEICKALGFNL